MMLTTETIVKAAAWLLLAVTFAAWLFVVMGLAVSTGTPHYAGSGWSQAKIEAQTDFVHWLSKLFFLLPAVFFADLFALWRLHARKRAE